MWSFRFFDHWCSRQKLRLFAIDAGALIGGFFLGSRLALSLSVEGQASMFAWWLPAFLLVVSIQSWLYLTDLYDLDSVRFSERQSSRLFRTLAVGMACFALIAFVFIDGAHAFPVVAGAVLGNLLLWAGRASLRMWLGRPARILVVGDPRHTQKFCQLIQGQQQFERVATFDWKTMPGHLERLGGSRVLIDLEGALLPSSRIEDALLRCCAEQNESDATLSKVGDGVRPFDLVVVSTDEFSRGPSARTLLELKVSGIPVFEAASFIERTQRRLPVELLRPDELVFARGFSQGKIDRLLSRTLDVLASIILLVIALPILAIAALAIKLDSKGPIFYRQERMGQGGCRFFLTKLRTMRVDAEHEGRPQWARVNDSRVTRVGRILRKCRIDELPQIFSVLRGEMSFVGPRPERAFFVEQLEKQIPFYGLRLLAKPGITGWAQVRYPYGASVEDARAKLEYDLYYLKNRSLFLDLTILFHTVRHVLMGKGAR